MRTIMTDKPVASQEALHKKSYKSINIRDLFMDKNPALAWWIPGLVYRLLSGILRIDFMNYPIPFHTFDTRHNPLKWAQLVSEQPYALAEDHTRIFGENHT